MCILELMYLYMIFIHYIRLLFFMYLLYLLEAARPTFTNLLVQMNSVLHPSWHTVSPSETYIGKVLKYLIKPITD